MVEAGVDRNKVHVVPNGVDAARFHHRPAAEARQALGNSGITAEDRVVLFVGNLVPVKGPDLLIEAWAELQAGRSGRRDEPGLRLVVIGDGPMRGRISRQAARLRVSGSVSLLGSRPHEEVALWMNAADALCLCSRNEGMPNVVLEALASGLPVAATDVGACREILDGEPAGRVVPAGGADQAQRLAKALAELLAGSIDREQMAARHQGYGWADQAERIVRLVANHACARING